MTTVTTSEKEWNYPLALLAVAFGIAGQIIFLPALDYLSDARLFAAFTFDLIVLIRIAIAYRTFETGPGWGAYSILSLTSPSWIETLVQLILAP